MKRTRRIEVIRYRRRVTVTGVLTPDQADDPTNEAFSEAISFLPEQLHEELRVTPSASARTRFLRRLLKAGAVFLPAFASMLHRPKAKTKGDKEMKKRPLKISAYVILATLIAMTFAQNMAPAQELAVDKAEASKLGKGIGNAIVGTWQVQVTIRNCVNGDPIVTFPSLLTYNAGGTLITTTSSMAPALSYPGQGVWQYVGGQHYTGGFTFFRFNSAGTFIGTQKIKQEIEYDHALDQLNTTATFEVLDLSGNVVGTGCVTAVGTRFEP